jgi:hypothetical protein
MILNQRKPPFQPVEGVFGPLAPDPVLLLKKAYFQSKLTDMSVLPARRRLPDDRSGFQQTASR